ncbi:MAG: hypothetical protein A2271_00025 [Candidatus Moranbacteria bacterium RIFOXYA12_FULL_35_19]|nr:MAG: hypothetical protein UR78_C0033G0005 [Candidatus Moranbacteria bacterium GW2011_GWF2_35_39]OGI32361.1 MAG: hypothetical protein A2489_01515 [Candidatus Moranbacteria bacterium RIFOXYC12_FULL_36_13]OGI35337.1 MAG: hypothetical protein A2271_00025 [Candidatus Moranbacteria bacterium RIFOXYA12_FULL_35_19]
MRIEEIKSIKYVRNFLDFNGNNIFLHKKERKNERTIFDLFGKVVIYAPNGIGKTNLSRLFDYISSAGEKELKELLSYEANNDDGKLNFSICIDKNVINKSNFKTIENKKLLNNLYVFNSDYIEANIKCDNFSKKNINGTISIPLGKENIKIRTFESDISQKNTNRKNIKDLLINSLDIIKKDLKHNKYKGSDLSIWQEFSFNKIINENFEITIPLKKDEFGSCEDKFKKIKGFNESDKLQMKFVEISQDKIDNLDSIYELLEEEKVFTVLNKQTEENISYITENWINQELLKTGIEKSEEDKKCLLCKRKIDDSVTNLFLKYKNYFENEKGKFDTKIIEFQLDLEVLKKDLSSINNNLQNKAEDFVDSFAIKQNWQELLVETILDEIEKIKKMLEFKKINPEISIKYIDDKNEEKFVLNENKLEYVNNPKTKIEEINKKIKKNKELITIINKNIDSSSTRETELRKRIGQKYLFDFYTNNKTDFDKIAIFNEELRNIKRELDIEKDKLPNADALPNIVFLFNKFLHDFIGLKKYTADIIDNSISLKLNNKDISKETKRISEGEKTMIGLCYFLAASIQKFDSPDKYKNSIFIIDDPICSTSYGNFFGICNLLQEFEEDIYEKLWKNEEKPKSQKIVLTHNTQFFNMIRANIFKEKALYFMLNKKELKNIPNEKLISEFETALCRIYEASKEESCNENIGNDMRRFFETLRHFYGLHQFEAASLVTIFPNFNKNNHKIFYSAINYYSHGNPEENTDPLPPENITELLKEFVELIEQSQFKSLWTKIKKYYEN